MAQMLNEGETSQLGHRASIDAGRAADSAEGRGQASKAGFNLGASLAYGDKADNAAAMQVWRDALTDAETAGFKEWAELIRQALEELEGN